MKKEDKNAIRKELHELGSTLGERDKTSGFRVPDRYFDTFPAGVRERITREQAGEPAFFGIPARTYRRLVPALVSVVLIVAVGIGLFLHSETYFGDPALGEDMVAEWEYFARESEHDRLLLYEMVMDSGMSAEEIFDDMGTITYTESAISEEMMEVLFERAQYYGIESSYLLSSLE